MCKWLWRAGQKWYYHWKGSERRERKRRKEKEIGQGNGRKGDAGGKVKKGRMKKKKREEEEKGRNLNMRKYENERYILSSLQDYNEEYWRMFLVATDSKANRDDGSHYWSHSYRKCV